MVGHGPCDLRKTIFREGEGCSKGSSTRGEFTSYKPAFLQAARKLAQCTHRTRLKAAFKKALEKVDSAGDFTRHSPAFERFRL
ncbi:hypothetical protein TNCV_1865771 [Trichonephila clavipes]|nr:hypothetical protein TNCV_1865771 [Trichonephila clavipes]